MIQKNINIIKMVQRKKHRLSIKLVAVLIYVTIISCSSQNSSNSNKSKESNASVLTTNDSSLSAENKEEIRDNDSDKKRTICLSNIMDEEVGADTTWIGQIDFNSVSNQIDTFWTMSTDKVYESVKLDYILDISNGLYVDYPYDYGYFEGDENFEIVNKINKVTDLAYALVLQENDSDCKELLDVLAYKRPYFISCAFESPSIDDRYVYYLAIGAYVNNDGTLYDKRKKGYLFYEGSHDYRIDKVYGINERGKLTMLESKFGVPINPNLEKYYFNDTIVFSLPY